MPRAFVLTDKVLATHRAGAALCLARRARGASHSMRAERPSRARLIRREASARAEDMPGEPPLEGLPDTTPSPSAPLARGPAVAVVEVRGLLATEVTFWDCGWSDGYTGAGSIVEQMADAHTDPEVAAIVVDVLSPGGDALGAGEAAKLLAAMREQTGKPVFVYAREACSAAYWLSASAASPGGLYCSESSDLGNVGCWTCHVDWSGANAQDGLAVTYIADPPGKVLGNPDEPLPDEARKRMSRDVAEVTARFIASITDHRPMVTAAQLIGLDGDTRRGALAVEQGLADGIAGSLDEVVQLAFASALPPRPIPPVSSDPVPAPEAGARRASRAPEGSFAMKFSAAVCSAAGIPAGATDAAAEAAVLSRLQLADATLKGLGETDPVKARGVLAARFEEAAAAPALRKQLAASTSASHEERRVKAVERAVLAGKLKPVMAWSFSEGPGGQKARGFSTQMAKASAAHPDIEAFEGYIEGLPVLFEPLPYDTPDTSAAAIAAAGADVALEVHVAASRAKVDPSSVNTNRKRLFPSEH